MSKKGLVWGLGINDADYAVQVKEDLPKVGGKRRQKIIWKCHYYVRWVEMLRRCYSKKEQERRPTHRGCTVCEEWLTFSNFRKWMTTQDWEDNHLDKDLLVQGNKVYSPITCVFVDAKVNSFTIDCSGGRGNFLVGCSWHKRDKVFQGSCNNPFTRKNGYIGRFPTEIEAHLAWKKQKHIYACQLADSEYVTDSRVQDVLLNKYKNFTVVEDHLS